MGQYLFRLPDIGEGVAEAEIVAWKVKVGDVIAVNDIVVEIETAKSLVELPSAGTVITGALGVTVSTVKSTALLTSETLPAASAMPVALVSRSASGS